MNTSVPVRFTVNPSYNIWMLWNRSINNKNRWFSLQPSRNWGKQCFLSQTSCSRTNCKLVGEISWNGVQPFLFTQTWKHVHSRLAQCCSFIALDWFHYFFLSGHSSQSVGVASQPKGIDEKDGLTVVACLKDVSVYSLYQRLYCSIISHCS